MNFPNEGLGFEYVVTITFGIWLLSLSVFVFFQNRFWKKLLIGTNKKDLLKVLNKILDRQELGSKDISQVKKEISRINEVSLGHVQKVALVRFNPFHETGGDHSFSLAVLDGRDTGFIITGLHTRERTRLYMKEVKSGKSDVELSVEEKKVLLRAQKS